jgi:hypothetical protein
MQEFKLLRKLIASCKKIQEQACNPVLAEELNSLTIIQKDDLIIENETLRSEINTCIDAFVQLRGELIRHAELAHKLKKRQRVYATASADLSRTMAHFQIVYKELNAIKSVLEREFVEKAPSDQC